MRKMSWFLLFSSMFLPGSHIRATPSTQIWNPSADIQGLNTAHFGIDNYFSVSDNDSSPYASPTIAGLTYGVVKNVEIGVDYYGASLYPLQFNVKYGMPETAGLPAFALGGMNFGTKQDMTDYNIIYGIASKTLKQAGRFSLGCYAGNAKLLVDENGGMANTGFIVTWDKTVSDKVWISADYASGRSFYGCASAGASYAFSTNTSVIFGYVIYNNNKVNLNNQFTTQLDINFQ